MKIQIKHILAVALAVPMLSSCLDEEYPTNGMTKGQVEGSTSALEALNMGVVAQMLNMGSSYGGAGFAGQMVALDAMTGQIPPAATGYDYFSAYSQGNYLGPTYAYSYDTWKLYCDIIAKANKVLAAGSDVKKFTDAGAAYVGNALAYRALAYFNMAQLYEYQTTGYPSLDNEAKADGVYGLTVPITTEATTNDDSYHNPRAPFYKMYRFILTDLNRAEELLSGNERDDINQANTAVVYGLKARFWLTLASRFDNSPTDLTTMEEHADDEDCAAYDKLGVTTAKECYENASKYARLAEAQGFTPMSKDDWYKGFNSSNDAWMFAISISSDDMNDDTNWSWKNFTSFMSAETEFGVGSYLYGSTRQIDRQLYEKMNSADWRKNTWIAPTDAGQESGTSKYKTILSKADFKKLSAYTGLKFKPGNDNMADYTVGAAVDIPLMRVEEMYFIDAEATAHASGLEAGKRILEDFMNNYRCTATTDNPKPFTSVASDLWNFTNEIIREKRIEFWGEGLIYFDYKRLKMGFTTNYDGTNHPKAYQFNFSNGYVAPRMNFCFSNSETQYNSAIINNPDPSGVESAASK